MKIPKKKLEYSDGKKEGLTIFYYQEGKLYPIAMDKEVGEVVCFLLSSEFTILDSPINVELYNMNNKENEK